MAFVWPVNNFTGTANRNSTQTSQTPSQPKTLPSPSSHHPSQHLQQAPLAGAQSARQQPQPLSQQPQHQSQQFVMNGMNGSNMGVAPGPGFAAIPTPAGHQAELNYIYGMVEELSRQLADNRKATEEIVNGLGKVRNKAKSHGLSNDQLIGSAAAGLQAENQNLDAHISILTESLEKANLSRDANANLLSQYANALALMLRQFHEYKSRHVVDVAVWHRAYRSQLDEARQENSRLREQIWEMQSHAGRANEKLRQFRRKHDEDERRWDRRVEGTALRQELRFWKRMAMPELEDDDPFWSDDDDMVDSAEKDRLRELEQRAAQEQIMEGQMDEDSDTGSGHHVTSHLSMMGGIAMQRDESAGRAAPVPPPRPSSAASSTGSTGHQV